MTLRRRLGALATLVVAVLLAGVTPLRAQTVSISFSGSDADSISPAPIINVVAEQVPPDAQPASITLVASLESQFRDPIRSQSAPGVVAQFQFDALFPEKTPVFVKAQVLDKFGRERAVRTVRVVVRSWLRITTPPPRGTNVLFTRQPQFAWSSPAITLPPGPWRYVVAITNTALNREVFRKTLSDTTLIPDAPLDACTSYRWSVSAQAVNGGPDAQVTISPGTFVIQSADCPKATISYQNFPNPFGRGTLSDKTCFWFDLAHRTTVKLTIYDLRLNETRRLVHGLLTAQLDSGAYGRQAPGEQSGCDPRLLWDGTDDAGRKVPPGVYIAVFEADGRRETKKILYRGP